MLEPMSNKSVVRFLVPLADIMALLFSFFLLLPHLEQFPGEESMAATEAGALWTPQEQHRIREELDRLRRYRELPVQQRHHIIVLDIDPDTGDLWLRQGTSQVRLTDANIDAMIGKHLEAARALDRELLYLLRVPPPGPAGTSPHPDLADEQRYRRWFHQGSHGRVSYQIDRLFLGE